MSVRPKKRPYLPTLRPLQRDSRYPTRDWGGTLLRLLAAERSALAQLLSALSVAR